MIVIRDRLIQLLSHQDARARDASVHALEKFFPVLERWDPFPPHILGNDAWAALPIFILHIPTYNNLSKSLLFSIVPETANRYGSDQNPDYSLCKSSRSCDRGTDPPAFDIPFPSPPGKNTTVPGRYSFVRSTRAAAVPAMLCLYPLI